MTMLNIQRASIVYGIILQFLTPGRFIKSLGFLMLAGMPLMAHSEGYDRLPEAIHIVFVSMVYVFASRAVYWFVGAAIFAWVLSFLLRLYTKSDNAYKNSSAEQHQPVNNVVGLLVMVGWGLMFLAVLALIVVGIGRSMGFKDVSTLPKTRYQPIQISKEERERQASLIPKVVDDMSWKIYSPLNKPWPANEGALENERQEGARGGKYDVAIYKTSTSGSIFFKLCYVVTGRCDGLRHAYMLNQARYTFQNVEDGEYEVRMLNLKTGSAWRSKPFTVPRSSPVKVVAAFQLGDGIKEGTPVAPEDF
ncbi:MAG TPA: hypothetical protein PKL42_00440 [Methylotenera sp.]|nr:hypothetical protein [Methylotenera sp.]